MDGCISRQSEIDHELRAVGRWEELPRDKRHGQDGQNEERDDDENRQPPSLYGCSEHAAIRLEQASLLLFGRFWGFQDEDAKEWREHHGDEPRYKQRDRDHSKQRERVFAGGA